MQILRWMTGLLLAGVIAFAAIGCGDDDDDPDDGGDNTPVAGETASDGDGDEAAAEKAVRDAIAAWNAQDVNGLVAVFTDAGLVSAFGEGSETREEIVAGLPEFIGDPPLTVREIDIEVSGEEATAETLWEAGRALENIRFGLVEDAGAWKIDSQDDLAVELPDGVEPVTLQMNEFAFALIATDVTAQTIAFAAENVGEQEHEIALAKIPADADVQELLMTEEDVPGFEFIGGAGPAEPGDTINLVLTSGLEPGRYLMVCFLPDTDDPEETPHAFKGMTSEFTIAP